MKRILASILILPLFLFCSELLPPATHSNWNIIQNDEIWIGWTDYGDLQWCRAKSILRAPMESISAIIEDKSNYPAVFKRVESVTIITDEIVHIVLDMPFPFYGRDYIVSYTQYEENGDSIYRFQSVKNSGITLHKDYVRLIRAAGEWRLHSLDAENTEITYTWNGELLGNFPDWALTKAWKTQGNEVLKWLKEAVQN
tara:strand:- start:155 stop:748 length:594 start_codon:yes stop_codon:yes gene_type:complete